MLTMEKGNIYTSTGLKVFYENNYIYRGINDPA